MRPISAIQALALAFLATLLLPLPSAAQSIYLDVNGDGVCDARDVLTRQVTSVDVYLATNRNADGSEATCPGEPEPLSFFGYEFILRAWGEGTVAYGSWIPSPDVVDFAAVTGSQSGGGDYYAGYVTLNHRPPGRYWLGTLEISVTGAPRLSPVSSTPMGSSLRSGFATSCSGSDFDNAYKLGSDFTDACGTAPASPRPASLWDTIRSLYR